MANFNITKIRPRNFHPSDSFNEVIESLSWSLSALSHGVVHTENTFSASESTNIIFGCELLPDSADIPRGSIIYNLEQPSHPRMDMVRKLAVRSGAQVWDFSLDNVADWSAVGIAAVYVPIGYTPNLTRIPKPPEQPIDVLFYGWLTPRRTALIDDLRKAGLKVIAVQNCYGGARDYLISQSKVVLNVHHDGRDMFEIVRCSYLGANHKCVITEESVDESFGYEYSRLVDECRVVVHNHHARELTEYWGFEWISKQHYVATVATALLAKNAGFDSPASGPDAKAGTVSSRVRQDSGQSALQGRLQGSGAIGAAGISAAQTVDPTGGHRAVMSVIQQRYERGLREGDMMDFLPWLRAHAKGQILEIGTRDGASTSAFLLGIDANGGHLTSIDIADCSSLWTHPQWTFHRGNSLAAQFPDASFDLALIDGDHAESSVIGDLFNCYHWVRPGGMILVHDLTPERGHEFYAVQIAERFQWFAELKKLESYILPGEYGLGVIKR